MATVKTAKDTVSVFIPKIPGEAPSLWVGLNGKSWSIPRGKRVEVPVEVAAIIERRERTMQHADEFAEGKRAELEDMIKKFG